MYVAEVVKCPAQFSLGELKDLIQIVLKKRKSHQSDTHE
jgi:hypothetical protein